MKTLRKMYLTLTSAICISNILILLAFNWMVFDKTPAWLPIDFIITLFIMIIVPIFRWANKSIVNKEEK